jgi:hypothetical protein
MIIKMAGYILKGSMPLEILEACAGAVSTLHHLTLKLHYYG